MVVVRSLLYHAAFYLATFVMLLATLPFFVLLRQDRIMAIAAAWSRMTLWLLRVVAGTGVEIRGRENLIGGASIIASKHQSMFETIALIPLLTNPTIVMKQSLRKIPLFGQCTVKTGMIHVRPRGQGIGAARPCRTRPSGIGEKPGDHHLSRRHPPGARRPNPPISRASRWFTANSAPRLSRLPSTPGSIGRSGDFFAIPGPSS